MSTTKMKCINSDFMDTISFFVTCFLVLIDDSGLSTGAIVGIVIACLSGKLIKIVSKGRNKQIKTA